MCVYKKKLKSVRSCIHHHRITIKLKVNGVLFTTTRIKIYKQTLYRQKTQIHRQV